MNKPTIRLSTKSCIGTSFHGHTITATRAQLKKALGKPTYVNRDRGEKVQHEWVLEIEGHMFTVYDWKEYRAVPASEPIEWHIGAKTLVVSDYAHRELESLIRG